MEPKEEKKSLNFIEQIIEKDIAANKNEGRVHTRFPPEPNGYLHIGHAKSICLNFGLAADYKGLTNLRFDDTNPVKEDVEYVEAIKRDIEWLGYNWEDRLFFASDYFPKLYEFALALIKKGKAYVDDSTQEEMSRMRGVPTEPGEESPFRNRNVEENIELFEGMKNGDYDEGSRVLRAKIDMTSPNMHMRDPVIYRILKAHHHRTGDEWCIYPMYDFAHGLSDSLEKITHSICTLEFEVHRPLYDWILEELEVFHPQQIEFARLNLNYTVTSKRKLLQLVEDGTVNGWDDPRMPTVSGLRRAGYTPASIREFAKRVGVAKRENVIDVGLLEFSVRQDLNKVANRVMAVLDPIKLVITNYPEGQTETLSTVNNPEDPDSGKRDLPFSRELYIERGDFMEDAPRKYYRLSPGRDVRLKSAYIVHCVEAKKDADGNVTEVHCTYYDNTKSGEDNSGIKSKGTLHWVSAEHAVDGEVRLYDRLFNVENPTGDKERPFTDFINPDSLKVTKAKLEPSLENVTPGEHYQFIRLGYFTSDPDSKPGLPVFNRTVTLKDNWAKQQKKG